jgi:hypothetical protein
MPTSILRANDWDVEARSGIFRWTAERQKIEGWYIPDKLAPEISSQA